MKTIIGILIIIFGVCAGIYLGAWLCLVGGIVQIIDSLKETPVASMGISLGILRVLIAAAVGWLTFFVCALIGTIFIKS